jgi:hypothetical protein
VPIIRLRSRSGDGDGEPECCEFIAAILTVYGFTADTFTFAGEAAGAA